MTPRELAEKIVNLCIYQKDRIVLASDLKSDVESLLEAALGAAYEEGKKDADRAWQTAVLTEKIRQKAKDLK